MDFEKAVDIIIGLEGGYSCDFLDPGGETKFGISKRAYPEIDIKELSARHAKSLYKRDYWIKLKCLGMPPFVRLPLFDCGVNQGVNFAARALQECLNVEVDGIIGPVTMMAAHKCGPELLVNFSHKRIDRYFNNKNFLIYGKGWINRLTTILALN